MNKFAMPILGACLLVGACNNGGKPAAAPEAAAPTAAQPAQATVAPADAKAGTDAKTARGPASASRVAEIKASGKTGIWSDPAETCITDHARGMIIWNVAEPDVDRVTVFLSGKTDKVFAQGGATGEKQTGPWLRPGLVFKLRSTEGARDLGMTTVAARQDCPKT
jgi:hypothetical protein